jgi:hypothetical protein
VEPGTHIPIVARPPAAPTLAMSSASPIAHALYVFLGVATVAVAIAQSGREEAPPLPALSHSAEMPSSRAASEIV